MNYKYLTKESIIRMHKKIVETTGGEKGMLNEGILSFALDLIHTEKLYRIAKNEWDLDDVIEWVCRAKFIISSC